MTRPSSLTFHGRHDVVGWWIQPALLGEDRARQLALTLWTPGAALHETKAGWWLVLPGPESHRAPWPAGPVVAIDGGRSTVPLTPDEVHAVDPDSRSLVVAQDGIVSRARPLGALDPSTWLDLGPLEVASTTSLRPPPEQARAVLAEAPSSIDFGVELAAERGAVLTQLVETSASTERPTPALTRLALSVLDALRDALPGLSGAAETLARAEARQHSPSWLERARGWLDQRLLATARSLRLQALLRERSARYLDALIADLDGGRLDDALRRALPLATDDPDVPSRPSLALPTPRDALTPSLGRRGGTSLSLELDSVYDELRERYERAAASLVRDGRITEAAYVLADLLDQPQRALTLLEEHGHYALAARLVLARALDPAWAVRLWCQAGDLEQAVAVARRYRAFRGAVEALSDQGHVRASEALRSIWATTLVAEGHYARAVEVLWPVTRLRPAARPWLDLGIALGGSEATRLLVCRRQLAPERFADDRALVTRWISDPSPAARTTQLSLVRHLRGLQRTPENLTLMRDALRALLPTSQSDRALSRALTALRAHLADPALDADLPVLHEPPSRPWEIRFETQAEQTRVHDVALLPSGELLVALGATGLLVVAPSGERSLHQDVPCTGLAFATSGAAVIGVLDLDGGARQRVCLLDRVSGRVSSWGEVALVTWARTFEDSRWFVAEADTVAAVDLFASSWSHLWRVRDVGRVATLHLEPGWLVVSTTLRGVVESWHFERPSLVLRRRTEQGPMREGSVVEAGPWGTIITGVDETQLVRRDGEVSLEPGGLVAHPAVCEDGVVLPHAHDGAIRVVVSQDWEPWGDIVLDGLDKVTVRALEGVVLCWGDGLVLAVETESGHLVWELRV